MKILDFFYTGQQAAEILGVKPITIWRWVKKGRFDVQHIGKTVLIAKWQVDLVKDKRHSKKKLVDIK